MSQPVADRIAIILTLRRKRCYTVKLMYVIKSTAISMKSDFLFFDMQKPFSQANLLMDIVLPDEG